jgi:transposase
MESIPKVRFTEEFKEEAAKMVIEGGLSVSKVATRLSIPTSTLAYWVKLAKAGKLPNNSKKHTKVNEEEMEIMRLKRELAEVKMECDILKRLQETKQRCHCQVRVHKDNATNIFHTSSLSCT